MLIALGGVIAGYDGSFSFEKIGIEFPDSVPYVSIRLVSQFNLLILKVRYIISDLLIHSGDDMARLA